MTKKKPSVEEAVAKSIKEKKKKIPDDWFDINSSKGLVNIPLDKIVPNPDQPRKTFNDETIQELANSIKEQGVISPVVVQPKGGKYEIIAGERRHRAAEKAGLKEIPALIRKVSKSQVLIISLIENIQREDLNDIDRALALRKLKESLGISWEKMAFKLGLTKQGVLRLVSLLNLPKEIQEDIRTKKLTERHGRALKKLKDNKDEMVKVSEIAKEKELSGDETERLVKKVRVIKNRFGSREEFLKRLERKNPAGGVIEKGRMFSNALEQIENLNGEKLLEEEKIELREMLNSIKGGIENIIERLNL